MNIKLKARKSVQESPVQRLEVYRLEVICPQHPHLQIYLGKETDLLFHNQVKNKNISKISFGVSLTLLRTYR